MAKMFDSIKSRFNSFFTPKKEVVVSKEKSDRASSLSEEGKVLIEELTSTLGPRPAATKESRRAARKIASLYEEFSNDVTITAARVYNNLGLGMLIMGIILTFIMFIFMIFNMSYISLAFALFYSWCLYIETKGKPSFLRRFITSSEAANVHAVLEPKGEVKRTVVFTSHHDSARINSLKDKFSFKKVFSIVFPILAFIILLVTTFTSLILSIIHLNLTPGFVYWPYILIGAISEVISLMSLFGLKYIEKEFSPGSGDNLSGVVTTVELLKYFSKHHLESTRIITTSFDAEECGLQGSKAWFKDNSHVLVKAKVINFDGLYKAKDLAFITSDGNGMVGLSATLARNLSEICYKMGYQVPLGKLSLLSGETDAASASLAGYEATCLTSMRPEVINPEHTKEDTPDKVEVEALKIAIASSIKYVENEDKIINEIGESSFKYLDSDKKYKLTK